MKKFLSLSICIFCFLSALALGGCEKKETVREYSSFAMGSVITVRLYGSDEENAERLSQGVFDAVSDADAHLSATKEDSDISLLNEIGFVKTDAVTVRRLGDIVAICNVCNRVIDPTIGAVSLLWNFSGEPVKPSDKDIAEALPLVDLGGILIDETRCTVAVSKGQKLDLGAFGKGIGTDAAAEYLRNNGSGEAIISFGGTVLLYGGDGSEVRTVGIRDPGGTVNDYFATLSLTTAPGSDRLIISTSGSYEKRFEAEGKTWHHILDAKTGLPCENRVKAVTVVSSSGLVSDALSTYCFIEGLSSAAAEVLGCYGAEAVWVFDDNSYFVTPGLRDRFTLTSGGFTEIPSAEFYE